ncbi:hypothetical protein HYV79_04340 [Candidatus Woesearchaeota archaeon]|nr:hypothetical protein [Candidatus Woesearchaeota archaeon]
MQDLAAWKKQIIKKLQASPDEISSGQRCPECYKTTLKYDPESATISCTSCGFKTKFKKVN